MLVPELRVYVLWTGLEITQQEALKVYRDRGTTEKYLAEFKTGMEK